MADILIIDDEGPVRRTIEAMLDDSGHSSHFARNGREAELLARSHHFDVAIVDIIMPEKDGIETIIDFRRDRPALKIIAMSGGGRLMNLEFLKIARQFGAMQALRKPFVRKDLMQAVDRCLAIGVEPEKPAQAQ